MEWSKVALILSAVYWNGGNTIAAYVWIVVSILFQIDYKRDQRKREEEDQQENDQP